MAIRGCNFSGLPTLVRIVAHAEKQAAARSQIHPPRFRGALLFLPPLHDDIASREMTRLLPG